MTELTNTENTKIENQEIEILLGQYLKEKRQSKNFSLEKLSQKTKISVNILKNLENNDFENLPSAAYIKGFVKNYVRVFGLPLDEAINKMEFTYLKVLGKPFPALDHTKQFEKTTERSSEELPQQTPAELLNKVESIVENSRSFLPFIILFIVIGGVVGGYQIISSIIDKESAAQRPKDLGPKIESSAALVLKSKSTQETQVSNENKEVETSSTTQETTETTSRESRYITASRRCESSSEFRSSKRLYQGSFWEYMAQLQNRQQAN
jgi:cytoskeletal protein RodZ